MIKVSATPAGIEAVKTLAADGVTLNVTLIFSDRQYVAARDSVWSGAQKRSSLDQFKSVYSIFVSRIDQFTAKHYPQLSSDAQGLYGIVNAKRIWASHQKFWSANKTKLAQDYLCQHRNEECKRCSLKYVAALAGSDIQTNPPDTNKAVAGSSEVFTKQVDKLPSDAILKRAG